MRECRKKNVGINVAHGVVASRKKTSVEAKHARKESRVKKL
jgi:hypothetical protein